MPLSNSNSPIIITDGLQHGTRIDQAIQLCDSVGMLISLQKKECSKTSHFIDKRNSAQAKYVMYMGKLENIASLYWIESYYSTK